MPTLFGADPSSAMGIMTNEYVIGALALSVAITALSYMAGEFFQMPTLKGFSKVELTELGLTAAILILAVLLITPGGGFDMIARGFMMPDTMGNFNGKIAPNMTCPEWLALHGDYQPATGTFQNGSVAFAQAHYFIGCRVDPWTFVVAPSWGELKTIYNNVVGIPGANQEYTGKGIMMPRILSGYVHLMYFETLLGFLSTVDFGFGHPMGQPFMWLNIGGFTPLIGLNLVSEANIFVVDALAAAWSGFAAQKMLLQFVEASVLAYFLPLGLFLRALPFTRKTGSTIIAVVFAAYFVYPTAILVNQRIFFAINDPQPPVGSNLLRVGEQCTNSSECASGLCRTVALSGSLGVSKCISPLTDFNEYGSVFQVCRENSDPETMYADWNESVAKQKPRLEALANLSANYYGSTANQAGRQIQGLWETSEMNRLDAGKDLAGKPIDDFMFRIVIGSPYEILKASFEFFETSMVDVSKYIILAVLFIVFEVVITLTLVKDVALLIGGEPRIFGLSKIV